MVMVGVYVVLKAAVLTSCTGHDDHCGLLSYALHRSCSTLAVKVMHRYIVWSATAEQIPYNNYNSRLAILQSIRGHTGQLHLL